MSIGKRHIEWAQCGCGCGESFPKYDSRGRSRNFIHGHNARGMKFPGQIRSEEWRRMKSDANIGSNNPNWKGGRWIQQDGYANIYKPDHPNANKRGYVLEHRLVIEDHLGRYLRPEEVVHHINGNRSDNRLENLQIFGYNAEHLRSELSGRSSPLKGRQIHSEEFKQRLSEKWRGEKNPRWSGLK